MGSVLCSSSPSRPGRLRRGATKDREPRRGNERVVVVGRLFTSVQDGVLCVREGPYALRPVSQRFSPSLAFETSSDRRWPSLVLLRKIVERLVFLAPSRRSMV